MRGEDGLDEFTTTAPTRLWAVRDGAVTECVVDAADLGLPRTSAVELRGGDAAHNADVTRRLLAGGTGPVRDAVLVNAAAAIAAYRGLGGGSGGDVAAALAAALTEAAGAIDSGAAAATLERWVTVARSG
jgi:anthranilate phosphoribosyltransferase